MKSQPHTFIKKKKLYNFIILIIKIIPNLFLNWTAAALMVFKSLHWRWSYLVFVELLCRISHNLDTECIWVCVSGSHVTGSSYLSEMFTMEEFHIDLFRQKSQGQFCHSDLSQIYNSSYLRPIIASGLHTVNTTWRMVFTAVSLRNCSMLTSLVTGGIFCVRKTFACVSIYLTSSPSASFQSPYTHLLQHML